MIEKTNNPIVFFDFDNTITRRDVLTAVIEKFSMDSEWKIHEEAWKTGKIGSRECLEAQLDRVRVSELELTRFVSEIEIDPYFPPLVKLLRKKSIPFLIVSDSFSFLIRAVLRQKGLLGVQIFANELRFDNGSLTPFFPYSSPECKRCAHCKKIHLLAHAEKRTIYIGDGFSDACPALVADVVFAKGDLLNLLRKAGKPCSAFRDFADIYRYFEDTWSPKSILAEV